MPTGTFGVLLQTRSLGTLAKMWLHWGAAYQEMKQGSAIINSTRDATEKLADQYPKFGSLRALVLWGENEQIVQPGEYLCDIKWACLPDHDHTSICKPRGDNVTPLKFVCQYEMTARSS